MWALTSDCSAAQVDGRASPRERRPVLRAHSLAALALVCSLPACASPGSGEVTGSSGTTGECPAGGEGCPCAENNSCGPDLMCASLVCVSPGDASSGSEPGSSSTTGAEGTGSSESTGEASASSGTSSSGDSSSGTETTTSESSSSSSTGGVERWSHEGVAKNVAVADLVGWELCWSDSYGAGKTVASITAACQGDHLMMACRPTGSDKLTVAAHAPREDVLFPVDYGAGERHEANGVNWYWSPTSNIEGFAPAGELDGCDGNNDGIQSGYLCWVNDDEVPLGFQLGLRCGPTVVNDGGAWERVMLQHS